MPTDQHNPASPTTQEPFRYSRAETARHLHDRLNPDRSGPSTRHAARTAGIPHTTLRYWEQRQQHTEAPAERVVFFESPAGLALLQPPPLSPPLLLPPPGTPRPPPPCPLP